MWSDDNELNYILHACYIVSEYFKTEAQLNGELILMKLLFQEIQKKLRNIRTRSCYRVDTRGRYHLFSVCRQSQKSNAITIYIDYFCILNICLKRLNVLVADQLRK